MYILGKKVRECLHGREPGVRPRGGSSTGSQGPDGRGRVGVQATGTPALTPPSARPSLARVATHRGRPVSASCPAPPAHVPSSPPPLGPTAESEGGQHLEGRWAGAEQQLEGRWRGWRWSEGACRRGVGPGCTAASQLVGAQEEPSQAHSGDRERGGQGWVGPSAGRLQDGWGPKEGVSPTARAALGASASLFLGINIYRFICRLPYTLGCLPPSKNRAGVPTPTLPVPTRAGDSGDQVRPFCSP